MYREFEITGMACASCQSNIQKAVSKMRGVHKVNVNLVSNSMSLECDDNLSAQMIIDKITSLGYGATECEHNSNQTITASNQVKKN